MFSIILRTIFIKTKKSIDFLILFHLFVMEDWNKHVKLLRILHDDHDTKYVAIEGEVEEKEGEKKSAVLIYEKTPFQFDDVVKLMQENEQQFKVDFVNDIYHKYTVEAKSACNGMYHLF